MEIASFDARLDGAHDDALELPGTARLDQLPAECSEQRVCDRWQPQLAHPLEARSRLADEWIAREAAQELGVIGVDGDDEPQPLQALLARGT